MFRTASILVLLAVALAGQVVAAPPAPASGKVVSVHDGDTLTVRTDAGETLKVRLHGVDAPELGQAFGARSRESLTEIAKGKQASVVPVDKDKYGRVVARVLVGGVEVNREQVARGMAWRYGRYDRANEYGPPEITARGRRVGLWADPSPKPPCEWRKTEKDRKTTESTKNTSKDENRITF
jgi:endonuclease YncB( thermonuclease family)